MIKDIKKLVVKYKGDTVGYLAELEQGIGFQYDDNWLQNGFSISPFSLPLVSKVFVNKKNTFGGLYGVFADSLPEGWGELLSRQMLSKKRINPDRLSTLTKLSLIGENGLGGLTYEPSQSEAYEGVLSDLDDISKVVKQISNDETYNSKNLDAVYKLGGSSGGARPKVHIGIDGEEWIVKFPCNYDPQNIGEKEYEANVLAKACDFNVNECRLFNSKINSGYFGAKRFDRNKNGRVHMISLSSVLETTHKVPNLDYIHLLQVVQSICYDQSDMYEAYGRMCFNVLYGNKNDHGKNFAFLYDEEKRGYKLSPFYDITQTNEKFEHEMTVNGSGNPTEKELLEVAKIMKLSMYKCKAIIEKIKEVLLNCQVSLWLP
ncbi:MAG: type II toxin-antitoxin system HipA family toxin [Clostridia bacterium]|nr:type II toxin-antitoxin system HipA family toxin [Clostridia bacterium]